MIAIATAQYQASDTETSPFDPTSDIADGKKYQHITTFSLDCPPTMCFTDDSENDSDEEEEDYSQEKEIDFIDVAARPSAVRAEVSAQRMLETKSRILRVDGKRVYDRNPLQKTIEENDSEGFVFTLELYQVAGVALWPGSKAHEFVVLLDRPDMLDDLTRRTGVGIPYPGGAAKTSQVNPDKAAEECVYLGLKIGGKRRANMSLQIPIEHGALTRNYDLLRNAISSGAAKVIEYLASPRILAAYTYYAATHSDDIAQYLKSVDTLETALPDFLGWQIDELNESPLLDAVIHDKLDILKLLFALKPSLMEEALHKRYSSREFLSETVLITAQNEVCRL